MKYFDVFDKLGTWIGTEAYADDFPDELIQTDVRTQSVYPPDVWVMSSDLADAGAVKARIEWVPDGREGPRCSFCGRSKVKVPTLVESAVDASKAVCGDCIATLKGKR
jgi:hypothetical protein